MTRGAAGGAAGAFTTDLALVVRSWDPWLALATGVPEADACGRPLLELFPELVERGLAARLRRVVDAGAVEVLAPAFHQYFIGVPPREASSHFARMQQHVTIEPLRAGEAIVGVSVLIEDVTARRDRERDLAAQLGHDDWRVRRAAAQGLAVDTRDDVDGEAVETIVTAVRDRHRDPAVLNAAVTALRHSERDAVLPRLVELLATPDADVRTYAALALGLLEDRRAVHPLLAALDDEDANVRFHAIEALGRVGSREAADAIARVAESRDPAVAFAALDALALIGEPSVATRIVPLLDDPFLGPGAADALGHLGDEVVVAPLVTLLASGDVPAGTVAAALARLHARLDAAGDGDTVASRTRATARPAAVRALVDALPAATGDERHGIVVVLGWLDDDVATRALAGVLPDSRVRRAAADALARRGAGALPALLEALAGAHGDASGDADDETRKAIAVTLGRIGAPGAVPALVALLDDVPEVAVCAAGALGSVGDSAAFEPLLARLDHPQAAVRHAVVAALDSIGHPDTTARVTALLADPSPRVREAAAKVAGYFGHASAVEPLLALCNDRDEGVRRTAIEQLALVDDPRAIAAIATALARSAPGERAAAARALAHLAPEHARPRLITACYDTDPWVRYYACRSAGRHGAAAPVGTLVELASGDPVTPVRIAAIEALAEVGDRHALDAVRPLVADPDPAVASAAIVALGELDDDASMSALLDALGSPESERRRAALAALGRRGDRLDRAAVDELARVAAVDEDADARAAAIGVLAGAASEPAVAALVELLVRPRASAAAVGALAGLGDDRVGWIARGLDHPDVAVRCATVEALARRRPAHAADGGDGAAAVTSVLARALHDDAPAVRLAAAQALGRLDLRALER